VPAARLAARDRLSTTITPLGLRPPRGDDRREFTDTLMHRRKRRTFALTPAGRAALRRWLADPVEPDVLRLELLLKLHVGGGAPPELMIEHLERYRSDQEAYRALLDGFDKDLRSSPRREPGRTYRRLTVRLGQHVCAARLAWAKEAIATLRRRPRG